MLVQLTPPNPQDPELPGNDEDQRVDPNQRNGGHYIDRPHWNESIVGSPDPRSESAGFHCNGDPFCASEGSREQWDRIADDLLYPAGDTPSFRRSPDSLRTTDEQELVAQHGEKPVDCEHRVAEQVGDPEVLDEAQDES